MTEKDKFSFEQQSAQAAEFLKALGNAHRLQVLCLLVEMGEMSVGQLLERSTLSQSALSQHLAKLREEGFIRYRREAQTLYYSLGDARVIGILEVLQKLFCAEEEE